MGIVVRLLLLLPLLWVDAGAAASPPEIIKPSGSSRAMTAVALTELSSGEVVSGISGDQGSDQYYFIDVPTGAATLTVSLVVGSGDPDIYVDTSYPPPLEGALCSSTLASGNDEICAINGPEVGRYYVRVNGWSTFSGASLEARLSVAPGPPTITGIVPSDSSLEVAFSAGSGGAPEAYSLTCIDQGSSKVSQKVQSSSAASNLHFVDVNPITVRDETFPNMRAFHESSTFKDGAYRCATHEHDMFLRSMPGYRHAQRVEDCSLSQTNPESQYDPVAGRTVVIPIYFHVIHKTDGTGYIERERIDDQMAVLNDDFGGTVFNGNSGFDTTIQFQLVAVDYIESDDWYTDAGAGGLSEFQASLAVNPKRYINVYTNDAGGDGVLGYATLPPGSAGSDGDGVVMLHNTIGGRNNGFGNYNQGRTLVHEIGHYLGLLHTFEGGGCDNTYTSQDLIVDTPPQSEPDYGSSASSSCSVTSAIENFMNYSNDSAMYTFTQEQTNRMICSQTSYRPEGYTFNSPGVFTASGASSPLTLSGLTNGNTYSCTVSATNTVGTSAASSAVTSSPGIATVPSAPSIDKTDIGDGEIYLYVSTPDDGGATVTNYTAVCTDGADTFTGTSSASPITVTGLLNGTAYTCTVTATNAVGAGAASASTSALLPEAQVTGLPIWLLYEASQ